MASVRLENLRKEFDTPEGTIVAVDDLNLSIEDGSFLSFLGPSGCGKTTTLRMLAGLEQPTAGEIYFDDTPVSSLPPQERDIGMVFQSVALFPHMTIYDNIGYGLKVQKNTVDMETKIHNIAEILQITDQLDKMPSQLSGGQRQRVSLGRAIVREPNIILFDEPLSDLDAKLKADLRVEIQRIHQEFGTTMIYVTHDQMEATTMSDNVALMYEGKLMQHDDPQELFDAPNNEFVGRFVGNPSMNFVDGLLEGDSLTLHNGKTLQIKTELDEDSNGPIRIGFRPQHVSLSTDTSDCLMTGTLRLWETLGTEFIVYLENDGIETIAISDHVPDVEPGTVIGIDDVARWYVFDSETEERLLTLSSADIVGVDAHSPYR